MKHISEITEAIFITGRPELRDAHLQAVLKELAIETKNIRLIADKKERDKRVKELSFQSGIHIETINNLVNIKS